MMTTKSKSMIVILSTLLLGMIIGLLLGGAIRHRKKTDFDQMPRSDRFNHSMRRIIRPTEKQKAAMDKILKSRYGQIGELRENFEEEIYAVYDSLKTDLDALLTDKQRKRLERRLASGAKNLFEKRLDRLTDELELTEEQREKMEELTSKHLPPMSRRPDGILGAKHRQKQDGRKSMDTFHKELQSILTPEQFEKFKKSNRRGFRRMGRRRNDFPPPHEDGLPLPPPPE